MSHKIFGYILVFILCWTEWILWVIAASFEHFPFPIVVIYATVPHIQGFLNAIVYGMSIAALHRHYSKRSWLGFSLTLFFAPILLWFYSLPRYVYRKCVTKPYFYQPRVQNPNSLNC